MADPAPFFKKGFARVEGGAKLRGTLQANIKRYARPAERALRKTAEYLKEESQKIVPYKTGVLHDSAYVEGTLQGWFYQFMVGYGASYAIWVHEIVTTYHAPPTQAKYLEQPAREKHDEMKKIFDDEFRRQRNS